jgi:glycosyltransferase involved in cell wall biosynthesis
VSEPTLALLIPAYNAAGFLPRLLASAHAQSRPFDEIWVYDDCSTDDTSAVAEGLSARVVRGAANVGCSAGKNALTARTGCDYVHFHDADDELKPDFVAAAHEWMRPGQPDVVLFAFEERDEHGRLMAVNRFDADDLVRDPVSFAIRVQINPFLGLYRREAIVAAGGHDVDPAVLYNEDVAFHLRLAQAGLSFGADPRVLVINHRRAGSMSAANGANCAAAQYRVMRKAAEHPTGARCAAEIAERLWRIAGVAAAYLDWSTADAAAALARRLSDAPPAGAGRLFASLCALSPPLALRARELGQRIARPVTRAASPRLGVGAAS